MPRHCAHRRLLLQTTVAGALLALPGLAACALPSILRVGVLPHLSARSLVVEYAPLRNFLSQELRLPVEVLTAPDYRRFGERVVAGDFDLVLTAPHLAEHPMTFGYRPLMLVRSDFYAMLVVPDAAAARSVGDLQHRRLHLPAASSLVSIEVDRFLRRLGFAPERAFHIHHHATENNALLAAERDFGSAAAASRVVFLRLADTWRNRFRLIGSTGATVSLVILLAPERAAMAETVRLALERFPYSELGLQFFESGNTHFVGATPAMMSSLRETFSFARERVRSLW